MLSESNSHSESYKYRLPIIIKRANGHLTLASGSTGMRIPIDQMISINLRSIDAEQFIGFDVVTQNEVEHDSGNGYRLFHTEKSASKGRGEKPSTYEYYKKDEDGSYAFVVASKSGRSAKHRLGSLSDPKSPISEALEMCPQEKWFLRNELPNNYSRDNAQVCKASFDILCKEGMMRRRQRSGYNKTVYEYFRSPTAQPMVEENLVPVLLDRLKGT